MSHNSFTGILFSGDAAHVVCLRRTLRGVVVKAAASLRGGRDEPLSSALRRFVKENGGGRVYLGLAMREVVFTALDVPLPAEENLREVLGYELDRSTPYTRENSCYDFSVTARDEGRGRIGVALTVAPRERVDECLKTVRDAGLVPESLETSSTAILRAVRLSKGRGRSLRYAAVNGVGGDCEVVLAEDDNL